MVFFGLVTAWRRATTPTSRSPVFENATTDGVVRNPSAFAITLGSPPSMTATHEFVVPRSMPMTLPMFTPVQCAEATPPRRTPARRGSQRMAPGLRCDLDLDLALFGLLGLGHVHLEHPVLDLGLHLVVAHPRPERERTLEGA